MEEEKKIEINISELKSNAWLAFNLKQISIWKCFGIETAYFIIVALTFCLSLIYYTWYFIPYGGVDKLSDLLKPFYIRDAVIFLLYLIISSPLKYGKKRFYYEKEPKISMFFSGFKKVYFKTVAIELIRILGSVLGLILFIVPGIIFLTKTRFVLTALAADNNKTVIECFKDSFRIAKGNTLKLILFRLSFIGWDLINIVTVIAGGLLYVYPYREFAYASLYRLNELPKKEVSEKKKKEKKKEADKVEFVEPESSKDLTKNNDKKKAVKDKVKKKDKKSKVGEQMIEEDDDPIILPSKADSETKPKKDKKAKEIVEDKKLEEVIKEDKDDVTSDAPEEITIVEEMGDDDDFYDIKEDNDEEPVLSGDLMDGVEFEDIDEMDIDDKESHYNKILGL